jgi:putative PEP-CTERM system TPR-repeat lipoprotein
MYRVSAYLLMTVFILFSGCSSQQKTKEQLVNDGINLVQNNPRGAIILFKNALEKDQNYFEARFQLAKAHRIVGNLEAAEKELKKVRRQDPSSREARIEMARVLVSMTKPDDALKELSVDLGNTTADCEVLEIAGWAHSLKENYRTSVSLLKKAIAACDASITSPTLSLAAVYAAMGKMQEAETQITKVLTKEPENRRALFLLADLQKHRKDRAAALITLDRIIKANPRDIEAQYQKGLLYIENGDIEKAIALSHELTKDYPDRPEGHRLQGFAFFFKKQYSDVIAPLQKSLLQQPNASAYYMLGLTHYYRQESEQAVNQLQKALDLQPTLTRARVHLAMIFLKKKRLDDALREAKNAVARDSDSALAHNILGSAYLAKGDHGEGIAELNRALVLDPSLVEAHVKKGLLAMKRGRGRQAELELAAAVRIKPAAQDARRILALYYINRREPAKAIKVLKKGIRGGHADAVTYYLMAESYLQQKNVNEARKQFIKAKEVDPKYELAYLKLASIYFMQQKQAQGVQELRTLVEYAPNNVQALLLLASFAEINGEESDARASYLRAADTKRTQGIIAAARYFQRQGDSEKTLHILNEGIRVSPADTTLHEVKGQVLFAQKNYKDALKIFKALERQKPRSGFSYLVNTYLAMGSPSKAIKKVRTEIKKNPEDLNLRAELSRIHYRMGDKAEAVEISKQIIRRNQESTVGYRSLAFIYQNSNEIDKAIEVLKSAPKRDSVTIVFMLGNLYSLKKDYAVALKYYRKIENTKVGADQVLFQKAIVLHTMGKKKEAETEYQKILRMYPSHAMTLNNLAYLYVEQNKNIPQALMHATHAFMLEPQNDLIRDTLGYVLLKSGRPDQGLRILKKASESSPENPSILYHLALAYKDNGNSAKAKDSLQKALALGDFPEVNEAELLLNKLKKE